MATLNPNKTKLPVAISIRHDGGRIPTAVLRHKQGCVEITVSEDPNILYMSNLIQHCILPEIHEGINYVKKNHETLSKYFKDKDFEFDDEELFKELRRKRQYRK